MKEVKFRDLEQMKQYVISCKDGRVINDNPHTLLSVGDKENIFLSAKNTHFFASKKCDYVYMEYKLEEKVAFSSDIW